jgi:hypothetical protein
MSNTLISKISNPQGQNQKIPSAKARPWSPMDLSNLASCHLGDFGAWCGTWRVRNLRIHHASSRSGGSFPWFVTDNMLQLSLDLSSRHRATETRSEQAEGPCNCDSVGTVLETCRAKYESYFSIQKMGSIGSNHVFWV